MTIFESIVRVEIKQKGGIQWTNEKANAVDGADSETITYLISTVSGVTQY